MVSVKMVVLVKVASLANNIPHFGWHVSHFMWQISGVFVRE